MAPPLHIIITGCILLLLHVLFISSLFANAFQLNTLPPNKGTNVRSFGHSLPSSWNNHHYRRYHHHHHHQKHHFRVPFAAAPAEPNNKKIITNHNCNHYSKNILLSLSSNDNNQDSISSSSSPSLKGGSAVTTAASLILIAFLYWYLLVFGAAAHEYNLPVPSWLPLTPGWPPSDADLAPAVEDSIHFFYISDLLDTFSSSSSSTVAATPTPPALRLAFFNLAESWVFAFFPLMLADKRRLPLPVVALTWAGALGLTNAFLAPYLAFREIFTITSSSSSSIDTTNDDGDDGKGNKNQILSTIFAAISSTVVGYAILQTIMTTFSASGLQEWSEFSQLVQTDRTYLAFCVDLVLFGFFQSFLIKRVMMEEEEEEEEENEDMIYNVPFLGLMAWLLRSS